MSALADPTTTNGGGVALPVVRFRGSAAELTIKDWNGFDLFLRDGMMKLGVERLVIDLRFTVDWWCLVLLCDRGSHGVDGEIDVMLPLIGQIGRAHV